MSKQTLEPGDVVQIDPSHDPMFGGAFMVVTEVKPWGAQGYVPMGVFMGETEAEKQARAEAEPPIGPPAVQAYYRCPSSAMTYIGRAQWDTDHGSEAE